MEMPEPVIQHGDGGTTWAVVPCVGVPCGGGPVAKWVYVGFSPSRESFYAAGVADPSDDAELWSVGDHWFGELWTIKELIDATTGAVDWLALPTLAAQLQAVADEHRPSGLV